MAEVTDEEWRDLQEMRERAATLYTLPLSGDYADTMKGAGAFVIFGEPTAVHEVLLAKHLDNRKRARTYVSKPDLCTKEGLLEWLQYFTAHDISAA